MLSEAEKLRKKMERYEQAEREAARKRQSIGAQLTQLVRKDDTRRKILVGSWALSVAEKSPDFEQRMRRELDRFWLVRDDDRRFFGLSVLSDEEKAAHPNYDSTRRGGRKAKAPAADLAPAPPPSEIPAPATEREREEEAA